MNINKINTNLILNDYNKQLKSLYNSHFYIIFNSYETFLNRIINDYNIISESYGIDLPILTNFDYIGILLGGLNLSIPDVQILNNRLKITMNSFQNKYINFEFISTSIFLFNNDLQIIDIITINKLLKLVSLYYLKVNMEFKVV